MLLSRIGPTPLGRHYINHSLGHALCMGSLARISMQRNVLRTLPTILNKGSSISLTYCPSTQRCLSLLLNNREGVRSASEVPFYARSTRN
jgi:hypothetical protein